MRDTLPTDDTIPTANRTSREKQRVDAQMLAMIASEVPPPQGSPESKGLMHSLLDFLREEPSRVHEAVQAAGLSEEGRMAVARKLAQEFVGRARPESTSARAETPYRVVFQCRVDRSEFPAGPSGEETQEAKEVKSAEVPDQ